MPFQKENLLFHYNWAADSGDSAYTGSPSRRLFDRFNGDQVLFIINQYAALSEKFTLTEAQKIENLITTHLPLEAKSEISVLNWLRTTSSAMDEEKKNSIH